ncbi:MAG: hypothetical protein J5881_00265 [Clostridia bacterium]|nr:hypothetical protein [Clostridia bacterium]
MDLGDISNIYKENLNSFFRNEEVIDLIYTEQFGSDNYNDETKKDYLEKYNSIIDNTLFIPYITLDDLDNMLIQQRNLYGDKYLKDNFSKELYLSKKIHAEKKEIIKRYSSFMLDDLEQLFPKLSMAEYSRLLNNCSNNSFEENANFIKDELLKDKNKLFTKFKKTKVEKIIEKYKKLSDEKILMETSSFYKHLSDVPKGKYYTDILEGISNEGQFVVQKIGKLNDKNIRYIFLPVFKYPNKTEYLKNALHEVMHISKEQITKKQYKTGLLVRELPKNQNASGLMSMHNKFVDSWINFRWSRKAKKEGLKSQSSNTVQRNNLCRRSNSSLSNS